MTSEETSDHAAGPHGDPFRSAGEAETSQAPQVVPRTEAMMARLRAPFDVGPDDAVEHHG